MTTASFRFISDAPNGDQFSVVEFRGVQQLGGLYRYELELKVAQSAGIVQDDILDHPAHFIRELEAVEYPLHGIVSRIDETGVNQGYVHYQLELVPRLWWLSLYKTNEIYTEEKTVDLIIQRVLEQAGLAAGTDFDLGAVNSGPLIERDYRCQFGESDFDFISRLMENEGIFYYFDHSGDAEKIVFAIDQNYPRSENAELFFDVSMQTESQNDSVLSWSCRKQRLAAAVSVRDYNPAHPSVDIAGSAPVDELGLGSDYLYGENIQDEDEATQLSEVRAQERLCHKTRYYGESNAVSITPGFTFSLNQHPNEIYNGRNYLCVEINEEGRHLDLSLTPGEGSESNPYYHNSFVALDPEVQFRPARVTPKPRFFGTMTAFVFAETGEDLAEIDEYGRYRVHLPFDRADGTRDSSDPDRKASAWIRMAQNYVGKKKGSYFPLTGGTEVLLSFINGDPDQPIIVGAVPNALEPSLLTADTEYESIVQTGSGNQIRMGDIEGEDRIVMESPTASSWMRIGTPNDPFVEDLDTTADGIKIATDDVYELGVGADTSQTSGYKFNERIAADTATNPATRNISFVGNESHAVSGSYTLKAMTSTVPPPPSTGQNQDASTSETPKFFYGLVEADVILDAFCPVPASSGSTQGVGDPTGEIKFELRDDKLQLDTGGRDFEIVCKHFNIDNESENNVTVGHDEMTHHGSATERFFGNSRAFHKGDAVEVFEGHKFEIKHATTHDWQLGAATGILLGGKAEIFGGVAVDIALAGGLDLVITGFKFDFNFSFGVEWTPLMFEIPGKAFKVKEFDAEKAVAGIKKDLIKLRNHGVELKKGLLHVGQGKLEVKDQKLILL